MQDNAKKFIISNLVKILICLAVFGLIVFGFYFNSCDGVWNGTYVLAGDWELSLGRWAIRYLDMFRYGVSVHPYSSIITLIMFSIGTYFISGTFGVRIGSFADYLASGIFLGNVVVCISLSYLYTSRTYGLAFALSGLCFWLITKIADLLDYSLNRKRVIALFCVNILLIAVILGLYQAYIGCLAELLVFYFAYIVIRKRSPEKIVKYVVACAMSAVGGGLAYFAILKMELFRYGVSMSSYKGADSFSMKNIIINLFSSVKGTYSIVFRYFNGEICYWNMLPKGLVLTIFLLLGVVLLLLIFRNSVSVVRTVISIVAICLFPMAANITTILIPNNDPSVLETAPLALIIPCFVWLGMSLMSCEREGYWLKKMIFVVVTVSSLLIIHGSIYQSLVDQETIRQGTLAAKSFSQSIMDKLIESGRYPQNNTFAFVGSPIYNPMVRANKIYSFSNGYARMLGGYPGNYLAMCTWGGILSNVDGISLQLCDEDTYLKLLEDEEVKSMPIFPQDGSILDHASGVCVVRVSEW